MIQHKFKLILIHIIFLLGCQTKMQKFTGPSVLLQTEDLITTRVSPQVYQHTTFFNSETFGRVPCNGMIVVDRHEALVFDTPPDNPTSSKLISWITDQLHCTIKGIIPTHFHEDCLGGLQAFHQRGIPSYALNKTITLAKEHNYTVPQYGFAEELLLKVGRKSIQIKHFGAGHTEDNVIGFFPQDQVLFGGCLIKELGAGKGNLADAQVHNWSATVQKIKTAFPHVKLVIPGHGTPGNQTLLDYTIQMFKPEDH